MNSIAHLILPTPTGHTFDFGTGPTAIRQHQNPDGSPGGWFATSAIIHPSAHIVTDTIIGALTQVEADVRIGRCVVIGRRNHIAALTRIGARTVIGDDNQILNGVIIGGRACIGHQVVVSYGARVGQNTIVNNDATILPGVRLGSETYVARGSRVAFDLIRVDLDVDPFTGTKITKHGGWYDREDERSEP